MSRVAKAPITLPAGTSATVNGRSVNVKGGKGSLDFVLPAEVVVVVNGNSLALDMEATPKRAYALAGTTRAILNNMVTGVSKGFERKLELVGVGYRAQAQGKVVNLSLGYSHPVVVQLPEGVTAETPAQNEIIIKGVDRQKVGQVCADIRSWRPPEPYKGKGVRYSGEKIIIKEAKKK